MTTGIHHVTGITADVQANVDFYAGFLGLRLVKRTGGYEDAEQLHLFYGDAAGSPGSLISFLVWESGGRGRVGHGQVAEIGLSVPQASIGDWIKRAMDARIIAEAPKREFGQTVLRFKDPDGLIVKLVGADQPATAPLTDARSPTRIHSVTLLSEKPNETAEFLTRFGYDEATVERNTLRMASDRDVVDVRDVSGYVPSVAGAGILDHVAFRAPNVDAVRTMRLGLKEIADITNVHDRKYFLSLYVREPAGTLIEYATDSPGMTVDEPIKQLGKTLFVPPGDLDRMRDLRIILPQFAMPGEARFPMRKLAFIHRFYRPKDPDGSTIVLLHGTGGNEANLFPLAHQINPCATLLGVRGRTTEEGSNRWFRRFGKMTFDQDDIRTEAQAFAAFIDDAIAGYGLDQRTVTFIGYSNGANLLGATLQLHPQIAQRAILMRSVRVLSNPPAGDLSEMTVLMLNGAYDPIASAAPLLKLALRNGGATVENRILTAGHKLTAEDISEAKKWLELSDRNGPNEAQSITI